MVDKNEIHGDVPVFDMRYAFRATRIVKDGWISEISFGILYIFKASLTFKCMTEHLFADFSYSIALDTYL